jgi:hypothetical protein
MARFVLFAFVSLAAIWNFSSSGAPARSNAKSNSDPSFQGDVTPFLQQYCFSCHGNGKHKGNLTLDQFTDETKAAADHGTWEKVLKMIQSYEMPPENKPQPNPAEREKITRWIDRHVFDCDCDHPDPGRVTIRRLNRAEYNNTIRDLVGVDFQPSDDFPADDTGYGFDNIGDALSLPPVLLEKYLAAAQKVLNAALVLEPPKSVVKKYPIDLLEVGYNAKQKGDGWVHLNSIEEDDVVAQHEVLAAGEYVIRVRAYSHQDADGPVKLTFLVDQKPIEMVAVETNAGAAKVYQAKTAVLPGKHRFAVAVRRLKDGLTEKEASEVRAGIEQKGSVYVNDFELEGPLNAAAAELPATHRRIFTRRVEPGKEPETAREILKNFARRAFRRPTNDAEIERLVEFVRSAWKRGENFEQGVALGLQAILISPHFLFRGEWQPEPDNPKSVHPVNEYALASRLSYFLWSSMPDEELFREAEKKTLRQHLSAQVTRMLNDPKSGAFIDNFAGQWLQLRNLKLMTPDPWLFPEYDAELRDAMERETRMYFEYVLRQDRPVLEFLDSDYSFLNERLARYYGIPNVVGNEFRRVSVKGSHRGGVLTHASILTITSNATRTSPVKRGKWVLDNILGAPPPPPPPQVPDLNDSKEHKLTGSLRERMEQHRADPLCASCHARMDPLGFGMENFNAIGGWRGKDGTFGIDPSGKLVTGETFQGPDELKTILLRQKRDQFVRCLSEKLLIYALGRGTEYYDKCALEEITHAAAAKNFRFTAIIQAVVKSTPFQMRRGEKAKVEDAPRQVANFEAGN